MSITTVFPFRLYLVITAANCLGRNFITVAEQAILGGVDIIQLREKKCATASFLDKAKRLKEITDAYDVPLIINDNPIVAEKADAHGIHVGNSDASPSLLRKQLGQEKMIGYSIEYLSQLKSADAAAADYLSVSPVFTTATKTDTVRAWGLEGIATIRQFVHKPLVAIGNINRANARAIVNAGADCIAVVSAICAADNPQKAAWDLKNEIIK